MYSWSCLCSHCSYSDGSWTPPVRRRYAFYLQCRYAVNTSSVIFMLTLSPRISEPYSVIAGTLACACTQGVVTSRSWLIVTQFFITSTTLLVVWEIYTRPVSSFYAEGDSLMPAAQATPPSGHALADGSHACCGPTSSHIVPRRLQRRTSRAARVPRIGWEGNTTREGPCLG
jgi:hypothetical protein